MAGPTAPVKPDVAVRLRLDKWLWHARFCKTRSDAADLVSAGKLRVNGQRMVKPGHGVMVQDVLTFAVDDRVRLIRVVALGVRRGPFAEARLLYIDLDAAPTPLE